MLEDSSRNKDFWRLIIEEKYQILDSALITGLSHMDTLYSNGQTSDILTEHIVGKL